MSAPPEPTSHEDKSGWDKATEWIWPHYDKITDYMKASGSPDAAVCVAVCVVFVVCLLSGYPYLGFAFGALVVVAYTVLTGARMFLAVKGKEHAFDQVVEEQLGAYKKKDS